MANNKVTLFVCAVWCVSCQRARRVLDDRRRGFYATTAGRIVSESFDYEVVEVTDTNTLPVVVADSAYYRVDPALPQLVIGDMSYGGSAQIDLLNGESYFRLTLAQMKSASNGDPEIKRAMHDYGGYFEVLLGIKHGTDETPPPFPKRKR